MFLDIESSTQIAERLGDNRFYALLNQFFYDLTDAVIQTDGEIYEYVGDEVTIPWKKQRAYETGIVCGVFF